MEGPSNGQKGQQRLPLFWSCLTSTTILPAHREGDERQRNKQTLKNTLKHTQHQAPKTYHKQRLILF